MNITKQINATYFKKSVTGETLFFFGVLPWPPTWTGYIVTSEDDIAELKSLLYTHQWVTNLVLVPAVTAIVVLWLHHQPIAWAPDSDRLVQVLAGMVVALAVSVVSALAFRRFVLDPILRKYPVSQERMSAREVSEARAATTDPYAVAGTVVVVLLMLGGGIAFLLWGKDAEDRIVGILLVLCAGVIAVLTLRTARLKRRLGDRNQWTVE